ncbi:MAG: hypothetical protein RLN99_09050, partial [Kiloniellaceae bacterium]
SVRWAPQKRDDDETSWREAIATHWAHTLLALVVGTVSYLYIPGFFIWLTPVLAGPLLSIPLSRFTSRIDVGLKLKAWGLFLTPAETDPPRVLQLLARNLSARSETPAPSPALFEQVITDPFMNALHRTLLERQPRTKSERLRLDGLIARVQENGAGSLSREEKRDLLGDPTSMATLHALAWQARGDLPPAPQGAVPA